MLRAESAKAAISRRSFLWGCVANSTVIATRVLNGRGAGARVVQFRGRAHDEFSLNQNWICERKAYGDRSRTGIRDATKGPITLPHAVTPLSWQGWKPEAWEHVWLYRRQFVLPDSVRGLRLFLHFERPAMAVMEIGGLARYERPLPELSGYDRLLGKNGVEAIP